MSHRKIGTTKEVFAVIHASHSDLKVFSSYSAPDGDSLGNPDECVMMTEYGFDGCDYPLIGAETTWEKDQECHHNRINEKHRYWICVGVSEE